MIWMWLRDNLELSMVNSLAFRLIKALANLLEISNLEGEFGPQLILGQILWSWVYLCVYHLCQPFPSSYLPPSGYLVSAYSTSDGSEAYLFGLDCHVLSVFTNLFTSKSPFNWQYMSIIFLELPSPEWFVGLHSLMRWKRGSLFSNIVDVFLLRCQTLSINHRYLCKSIHPILQHSYSPIITQQRYQQKFVT